MSFNRILILTLLVIFCIGFLCMTPGDIQSMGKEPIYKSQQDKKDDDSLDLVPLLDLFSKDCYKGCFYACKELMKGNPDDCRAICEDLCGKSHVAIITKLYYDFSRTSHSQITTEAMVSVSYELEPLTARFFKVKSADILYYTGRITIIDNDGTHVCHAVGANIESNPVGSGLKVIFNTATQKYTDATLPPAMPTIHFSGDSDCSGPFYGCAGIFRDVVKAQGGEVTKLGGSRSYFGERIDLTKSKSTGYFRWVYQFEIIQR